MKSVEILAPAGSAESLKAAVCAGADAVYAGGDRFGARAYAENFTGEELLRAIDYVHIHGRKLYLTVNTLIKDSEMEDLEKYLRPFYEQGLDAAIVQDIGAMDMIRERFPDLAIHVSTQATVTGVHSAKLFRDRGAVRVVPARELSLPEIRRIKKETGMEVECFVHGALCYCYSGQCLMSSMIGGRSGNRGQCAQPCRLPYSVGGGKAGDLLSLKDLCAIDLIPELIGAGVDSFKIEGRMKQPGYVYTVTQMYRKYADRYLDDPQAAFRVEESDRGVLADAYRRRGYIDGYFRRRNGREMISLSRPKESGGGEAETPAYEIKEKINGKLILLKDERVKLEVTFRDITVSGEGMTVQEAKSRPLERERVEKQMRKTGNTEFAFDRLEITMDGDIFLPMQALNELRRDTLSQLEARLLPRRKERKEPYTPVRAWREETPAAPVCAHVETPAPVRAELTALVSDDGQLACVYGNPGVDAVYLEDGVHIPADAPDVRRDGTQKLFFAMPRIFRRDMEEQFEKRYPELLERFDGVLVRCMESLAWLRSHGYPGEIRTDHSVSVFNRQSIRTVKELGVSRFTASLELNCGELRAMGIQGGTLVVCGYQPVMVTANCIARTTGDCPSGKKGSRPAGTAGACKEKHGMLYLTDRYGNRFPVKCECGHCGNVIYNCRPLALFQESDKIAGLSPAELRMDFTVETPEETERIVRSCRRSFAEIILVSDGSDTGGSAMETPFGPDYTKGHFKRGVK